MTEEKVKGTYANCNTIESLAESLLKTCTGGVLGDSGSAYGYSWQRNQEVKFQEQPTAWMCYDPEPGDDELIPVVSLYHWIITRFELDDLCREFNALPCDDWDSDAAYGLSLAGEKWLSGHGFKIHRAFNSYNGECDLSQTIQGSPLSLDWRGDYFLLQVHQGCDVRGGYTDAILLRAVDPDYISFNGNAMAVITRGEKKIMLDNMYNGWCLTDGDDGNRVTFQEGDKIEAWLMEF